MSYTLIMAVTIGWLSGLLTGTSTSLLAQPSRPLEKVQVALPGKNLGFLPLLQGTTKGFYREEGIDLRILVVKTNIALNAMRTGSIDFTGSLDSAVMAAITGAPFKVVFVFNGRPAMYFMANPRIKSVPELKGKVVGFGSVGNMTWRMVEEVLTYYGLNPDKDVTHIGMPSSALRFAALKAGSVDAALLALPYNVMAKKAGFNEVADLGDIFADLPAGGLSASDSKLRDQPQRVKRFLRATLKSLIFMREHRDETIGFMQGAFNEDRDTAAILYGYVLKIFTRDGSASDAGLERNIRLAKEVLQVKTEVPISKVADFSLLRAVQRELLSR